MHRRLNIVFSTSLGWNPGDEFILRGILRLFRTLLRDFNPIIYNRHPSHHFLRVHFNRTLGIRSNDKQIPVNFYQLLKPHLNKMDNGWRTNIDFKQIDLVVFAGTPEWLGVMNHPLVEAALEHNIPAMYLGVGSFPSIDNATLETVPEYDRELLKKAVVITTRDETACNIVKPLHATQLTCPSFLSCEQMRKVKKIQTLSLSTQAVNSGQALKPDIREYTVDLFKLLSEHYKCRLVLHYIDDLVECSPIFEKIMPIYYSYDSRDYPGYYRVSDLTVNSRVHGVGVCASQGVPGIMIAHTTRTKTANGFLAECITPETHSPEAVLTLIREFDVKQRSVALHQRKKELLKQYQDVLRPVLQAYFPHASLSTPRAGLSFLKRFM